MLKDPLVLGVYAVVFVLLLLATVFTRYMLSRANGKKQSDWINIKERINSWWIMIAVLFSALALGKIGSALLFLFISFQALREFVTLTPTQRADHRALFWAMFIILPFNYYLIATDWYGLFVIFIPVYAFLWLPIRQVIAADTKEFLARTAKIQWGLMTCVYCISYAPALINLDFKYFGYCERLLLFLVLVVESCDILQYIFGKLFGKTKIAPHVSPNKTIEGFVGGVIGATILGASLWWLTPFLPWQAAIMSLLICLMGFAGDLVLSAIKRDMGVKEYSAALPGHGGMLDRIDSLCFAAPVFFHATRYFFC